MASSSKLALFIRYNNALLYFIKCSCCIATLQVQCDQEIVVDLNAEVNPLSSSVFYLDIVTVQCKPGYAGNYTELINAIRAGFINRLGRLKPRALDK